MNKNEKIDPVVFKKTQEIISKMFEKRYRFPGSDDPGVVFTGFTCFQELVMSYMDTTGNFKLHWQGSDYDKFKMTRTNERFISHAEARANRGRGKRQKIV
jgi:hypothetical protein